MKWNYSRIMDEIDFRIHDTKRIVDDTCRMAVYLELMSIQKFLVDLSKEN